MTGPIPGVTISVNSEATRSVLLIGEFDRRLFIMLPAHIIHDILERERKRRRVERLEELVIEIAELPPISDRDRPEDQGGETVERGVVILDFTI